MAIEEALRGLRDESRSVEQHLLNRIGEAAARCVVDELSMGDAPPSSEGSQLGVGDDLPQPVSRQPIERSFWMVDRPRRAKLTEQISQRFADFAVVAGESLLASYQPTQRQEQQ